jgi:superfamily I DNA/RNA helicase
MESSPRSAHMISDPDQDAVLADESPCLLIVAPPGSGKTRTAVRLIARDIEAGRVEATQRALAHLLSKRPGPTR